jgi:hypothetical protein
MCKLTDEETKIYNNRIEAEAVDVQPIRHGQWINVTGAARCETSCTCCNGKIMKDRYGAYIETPFCPHCGADLR